MSAPEYFSPVPLSDRRAAFSIKRQYPNNIRYKPPIRPNGNPDNVAVIWVIYNHPDESGGRVENNRVPVSARVANISLFRQKYFDYDFNNPDSPTEEALGKSKATPMPVDLNYEGDFFYDHNQDIFVNESGSVISGIELLNKVFSDHCSTVHWRRGFSLRFKLFAQSKSAGLIPLIVTFLKSILKNAFGRTLEEDDATALFSDGYKKNDFKKLSENSLNVFGYKASKQVIFLFCVIVFIGAIWGYNAGTTGSYFGYIGASNFLSVIHGLLLLLILDCTTFITL